MSLRNESVIYINAIYDYLLNLQLIRLEILKMSIEACPADKLDIHDGPSTAGAKIGTSGFCGEYPNTVIHSYGANLYLRFVTNAAIEKNGFLISILFLSKCVLLYLLLYVSLYGCIEEGGAILLIHLESF